MIRRFSSAAIFSPDEPKATAVLTSSQTDLGPGRAANQNHRFVRGEGAGFITGIDGLDIRYSGQSQMIEGHNLRFSYSFVYSYTVMPDRTGTFRIPSQKIQAGSNSLHTPGTYLNAWWIQVRAPATAALQAVEHGSIRRAQTWNRGAPPHKDHCLRGRNCPGGECSISMCARARIYGCRPTSPAKVVYDAEILSPRHQTRDNIKDQILRSGLQFQDRRSPPPASRTRSRDRSRSTATGRAIRAPAQFDGRRSPFDIFQHDDPFCGVHF